MGKACTKEKSNQGYAERKLKFSKSLQLLKVFKNKIDGRNGTSLTEPSFSTPEVRPPHSVIKESLYYLAKNHRFYVHLYGLKARALKLKKTDSATFCVVNWDDYAFEKRTKKVLSEANPRWGDAIQFYYSVESLTQLCNKYVILKVYEDYGSKARMIGAAAVDLMTVATGPIHHDLFLQDSVKLRHRSPAPSSTSSVVGRLIFDLRMAQICQLTINPVEVLAHIHDSLDALDKLEVEGIGTRRAGSPLATEAITRTSHVDLNTKSLTLPSNISSPASEAGDELRSESPMLLPSSKNERKSGLAARTDSGRKLSKFYQSFSFPKLPIQNEEESSSTSDVASLSSNLESTPEDPLECVLEALATRNHVESESLAPILAEWQLTFIPTGVDEPVEFCSSFTPFCDQPYWNAVDHTIINELMEIESSGSTSQVIVSNKKKSLSSTGTVTPRRIDRNREGKSKQSTSQLIHKPISPKAVSMLRGSPWKTDSILQPSLTMPNHRPLSPKAVKPREQRSALVVLELLRNTVVSGKQTEELQGRAKSWGNSGFVASSALLETMSATHLDHIQPEVTYHKLASICQRGRLVREMLYDDLPTIQLETTSDFLRLNHLKLRIYGKRLGMTEPKFYGEAWLPFFKIYDIDVVEQMHQNFSDAYFREKLWYEGKCIGHIEGVIVFQNNPMVRQMVAGVNTGAGFLRISPPVLIGEPKSAKFGFWSHDIVPDEIKKLLELHQALLDSLFSKAQHRTSEAGYIALSQHTPLKKKKLFKLNKAKKLSASTGANWFCALPNATIDSSRVPSRIDHLHSIQPEFHVLCDQVLQLLRVSHVETRRSFLYKTQRALIFSQKIFLNLADHVLEFADYVPWQYRSTYTAILHQILRRGELDIGSCLPDPPVEIAEFNLKERKILHHLLKRSTRQKDSDKKTVSHENDVTQFKHETWKSVSPETLKRLEKSSKQFNFQTTEETYLYHKRMKICKHYCTVLHRVLNYCLIKYCGDSVFEGQRKYISIFLSLCYFRVPEFRKDFLESVLSSEERKMVIPEWRGTEYELDDKTIDKLENWQANFGYRLHLDWSPLHESLQTYFGEAALEQAIQVSPPKPECWKQVIEQRGPSFFSFLEYWSKHVYQIIPSKKSLQWHLLPGYATLLKAVLIDMKSLDVTKYPDALINCTGAVLANERLLSVFIKILFLKTCVFNNAAVFSTLDFMDYWTRVLALRSQAMPPNFDFEFFRRGLDIVLGSNISLCVAKGLWFLYKNLPIFKLSQLDVLVNELLLEKYFYTLFLNWSWLVRRCYIWIMLYRICETTRLIMSRHSFGPSDSSTLPNTNSRGSCERKTQSNRASFQNSYLTVEEKLMLLSYLELSRRLEKLNALPVFAKNIIIQRLNLLLACEDLSLSQNNESSLESLEVIRKVQMAEQDQQPETGFVQTHHHNNHSFSHSRPQTQKITQRLYASLAEDEAQDHSRFTVPEHVRVYIKSASGEFNSELEVYRHWTASSGALPIMQIPSSPLDSNVDVPVDT